jgi:hypothetical protein
MIQKLHTKIDVSSAMTNTKSAKDVDYSADTAIAFT